MGTITDRFHEENYTDKITPVGPKSKYLIEIERTGEIVLAIVYDYRIYIQRIFQDTVVWTRFNEQFTIIKNLDGII